MNNRVTITFNSNFVAGDSIGVYYSDPISQLSGYWTFFWVSGTPGTFQVQIGTPTTTPGEIEAIRFASAWSNSLNGFTVTQPVGGNVNQVQITSQTYHFVNVLAKFADSSTMAIPGNYQYSLSTVSTGYKITYEDKLPLNLPAADSKYLWRSVNANEVKTKFNLNDDRIGTLETDKADLVGGNEFTGNQNIEGLVLVKSGSDSLSLNNYGLEFNRSSSYIRPISNSDKNLYIGGSSAGEKDWSLVRVFSSQLDISGNVGIGTDNPSGILDVVRGSSYLRLYDYDGASNQGFKILIDQGDYHEGLIEINNEEGIKFKFDAAEVYMEIDKLQLQDCNLHVGSNAEIGSATLADSYMLGSLGVGTSTPTEKLEVDGNALVKGNIYEHFTITSLTSSYNLTNSSRFLLYSLSSNGTLTIPTGLGVNSQEWKIVNASGSNTLTVSAASGVTLGFINNDGNSGAISAAKSATLVRYEEEGYYLIKN